MNKRSWIIVALAIPFLFLVASAAIKNTVRDIQRHLRNQDLVSSVCASDYAQTVYLLESGADPNTKMENVDAPVVSLAAGKADAKTVKLLLKYGANPDVKDDDGLTALDYAKDKTVIRLLKNAHSHR